MPSAPTSASPGDLDRPALAALEPRDDLLAPLGEAGQPAAHVNPLGPQPLPHGAQQHAVQLAPMDRELRRLEPGVGPAQLAPHHLPEAVGVDQFPGADARPVQLVEQPEGGEFLDRVRQRVDADAEFAQFAHLLEHLAADAGRVQRQRRRQAADPAADDHDVHRRIQAPVAAWRKTLQPVAVDNFARENLPPPALWPEFRLAGLGYPEHLNCVAELLDAWLARGHGDRPAMGSPDETWSYAGLAERVNRIANVLTRQLGVAPGNRVLLRAPNTPMLVAATLAVMKAGGIAVPTMPLLRARELGFVVEKARIGLALCDHRLLDEASRAGLDRVVPIGGDGRFA